MFLFPLYTLEYVLSQRLNLFIYTSKEYFSSRVSISHRNADFIPFGIENYRE